VNKSGIDARNGQAYHGRQTTLTNETRPASLGPPHVIASSWNSSSDRERFNEVQDVKVAIYARYSSDNQRDASIADQLRVCRAYAERQGWTICEE
jgi:hypothetical protein